MNEGRPGESFLNQGSRGRSGLSEASDNPRALALDGGSRLRLLGLALPSFLLSLFSCLGGGALVVEPFTDMLGSRRSRTCKGTTPETEGALGQRVAPPVAARAVSHFLHLRSGPALSAAFLLAALEYFSPSAV